MSSLFAWSQSHKRAAFLRALPLFRSAPRRLRPRHSVPHVLRSQCRAPSPCKNTVTARSCPGYRRARGLIGRCRSSLADAQRKRSSSSPGTLQAGSKHKGRGQNPPRPEAGRPLCLGAACVAVLLLSRRFAAAACHAPCRAQARDRARLHRARLACARLRRWAPRWRRRITVAATVARGGRAKARPFPLAVAHRRAHPATVHNRSGAGAFQCTRSALGRTSPLGQAGQVLGPVSSFLACGPVRLPLARPRGAARRGMFPFPCLRRASGGRGFAPAPRGVGCG